MHLSLRNAWFPLHPLPPGQSQINFPVSSLPSALFDADTARLLFDHALTGIAYCRMQLQHDAPTDFLFLYVNPAGEAQTGLRLAGKQGSEVLPKLYGQDRVFLEILGQVARGGEPKAFCMCLESVGKWLEWSVFSPRAGHFVAMFNIVTSRVEKSNASLMQNQWWSDGINAMSEAVFVCDREGRVLDVNDSLVKFHRFDNREACLDAIANYRTRFEVCLLDGKTVPFFQWAVPRALRGERAMQQHFRLTRTDTGEHWIGSYDFAPIKNEAGVVMGAIVVGRDVTAEHQQRQALEKAAVELAEMKQALTGVGVAVYRLDSLTGKLLAVDDLMQKRLGYSEEELLERTVLDINTKVTPDIQRTVMAKLEEKGLLRIESSHRTKTGEEIPVEVLVFNRPQADASPTEALAFARDITQRRERSLALEQLQRSVEQLSESTVASVTAAALAHELNQPLTTLALSAAAALNMLDAGIPSEAALRGALTLARDGAENAGDVVRDLLAFLNKRPLRMERLDLAALLRKGTQRVRSKAPKGVLLRTRLPSEPIWVFGNALQLEKVFANLMRNGLEALEEDVKPKLLSVGLRRDAAGAMVRVSVVDSGAGIPEAQLQRVFEPFFTTKPTGIGMGLAICDALVRAHGGRIWAQSKPGRGAALYFELPLADAPQAGLPDLPLSKVDPGGF